MQDKKYIFILLDIFLKKNQIQHDILVQNGYYPIWLQCSSQAHLQDQHRLVLPLSFAARSIFLIKLLSSRRKQIHHIEIYPGGRYAAVLLLIAKLLRLKVLCAERGDLYYLVHKKYNGLTRFSGWLVYRFSSLIWTRELYAERYLKQIRIQTPQRFIHNVIQLPDFEERNFEEKDIDFLWVNSLKDFRKVDWFLNALKSPELKHSKAVLLGLTDVRKDEAIYKMQIEMLAQKPNNLEVVPYTSPQEFYRRSRYFILPTSLVFLNNALLEAMSYGVVPIITNAEGSDLVIDNRKNGFISAFTEESFKAVMIECSAINKTDYQRLSREAIEKTKSAFSPAYYENQLMKMYSELEK